MWSKRAGIEARLVGRTIRISRDVLDLLTVEEEVKERTERTSCKISRKNRTDKQKDVLGLRSVEGRGRKNTGGCLGRKDDGRSRVSDGEGDVRPLGRGMDEAGEA